MLMIGPRIDIAIYDRGGLFGGRFPVALRAMADSQDQYSSGATPGEPSTNTFAWTQHQPPAQAMRLSYDNQPPETFAERLFQATPRVFLTPTIVAANVAVYLWMIAHGVSPFTPSARELLNWGADFWPYTTSGQWWRLFTSGFLHFGALHIAMNMWAFYGVGRLAERLFGNTFFGLIYLFALIASGFAATWWNQDAVGAGASGAIFGVYGAFLAYLMLQPRSFPAGVVTALRNSTLTFVAYNVFFGLTAKGISNAAHIGGLVSGLAAGAIFCRPIDLPGRTRQFLPRLAIGILICGAILAACFMRIPKAGADGPAEIAFAEAQEAIGKGESPIIDHYNEMLNELKAGKLKEGTFAATIDSEFLPAFDRYSALLADVHLSDQSPDKRRYDLLVEYCKLRRDSFALFSQRLRSDDPIKALRSTKIDDQLAHVIKELNATRPK